MPHTALRPTSFIALALLLAFAPSGAEALGLGRPQIHSALGKPLDASIPLMLADGEQLTDACVRAEVSAGDARVPAGLLQTRIEGEPGQRRVRLQSLVGIEEPALRITLALGCPLRLTREFNAFIDPPATAVAMQAPALIPPPAPPPPPIVEAARPMAEVAPAPAAAPAVKPRPRVKPKPRASGPRLVLERPEVLVAEAPVRPVAEVDESPELEAQISQLEQTVAELRAELEARLQAAAAASAAAAIPRAPASVPAVVSAPASVQAALRSPYRDPMTWLLALGAGLLVGAATFYGMRWRDERARRELAYLRALHAGESVVPPAPPPPPPSPGIAPAVTGGSAALPDESQHPATRPQPRPLPWPPSPAAAPVVPAPVVSSTAMQATQPMPIQAARAPVLSQELTVADELLDLQQQVDFLQLLGQHEAAADLLATRLSRGSAGAMPYLLLMEICQQRGEPEVFEELSKQFVQRFGSPAPQWAQSLSRGRGLDSSPSVIAHLQVGWHDPAGTMQMLQELLGRGAGPGAPHFELPAYRDLLTLYSVARDLFEAGLRGDDVDVMLPIDSKFGEQ